MSYMDDVDSGEEASIGLIGVAWVLLVLGVSVMLRVGRRVVACLKRR